MLAQRFSQPMGLDPVDSELVINLFFEGHALGI
jgi:hypothetical protein